MKQRHDVKNRADTVFPREIDWEHRDPSYFVTMGRSCRQIANDCDRGLEELRARKDDTTATMLTYGRLSYKRDCHRILAERLEKQSRKLYRHADRLAPDELDDGRDPLLNESRERPPRREEFRT